ncbi:NAD(P)H-hydrate dehydratase [Paracoccus sp. Ld10]|uniref:NAD(P)H-hydrate dehydratase n=1 Tax=Paracoccus sp. Ld10 TaxID=649158 RepID=UPI003866368C
MLEGSEIVTTAQMRAIESAAIGSGAVSGLNLMTRAGGAVAGHIRLRWPKPGRATVLCGPGANGGDGYVVARLLAQAGWIVRVLGMPSPTGSDAAAARARWSGPILPLQADHLDKPDLFIDAMLGTGLTRPPDAHIADILLNLATAACPIVAVDAPSGLCLDSGIMLGTKRGNLSPSVPRATLTVAFDSPKPGHLLEHGPRVCGTLVIADIGIGAFRATGAARLTALWPRFDIADPRHGVTETQGRWLRKQASGGHKYDHGAALVVAGGVGAGGAARLAARAALRVGAGLVTLAPPATAMAEHARPPDALMRRAVDDADALTQALSDRRGMVLCLGPGCGVARAGMLLGAARAAARPMVLDADALTALALDVAALPPGCVLTPHGGEFARLFPDLAAKLTTDAPARPKTQILREAALRIGAVVVLKGPDTVIADPQGQVAIHSDPHIPWLATAGSGDVLAGIITGLLARGLCAFDAACLGVRLHGAVARHHGPGLIADDLTEGLVDVIAGWDA